MDFNDSGHAAPRENIRENTILNKGIFSSFKARLDRNRLGELLVMSGVISAPELQYALAEQRINGTPLGRVLLQQRMIRRRHLYQALAQQWAMRAMMAAMTIAITIAAFGIKPARADAIRDLPAQVSLVSVANAAFAPVGYYPALFGSAERKSGNLKPFVKWTGMFDRFEASMATPEGSKVIGALKNDLKSLQGQPLRVMAQQVDRLINQTAYIEDSKNWGKSDYWGTPIEFLTRGGDCEDFAITKYTALRALGVPEDRLRIAIVHDIQKDIPHAILIVYADEGAMILDNQSKTTRFADTINNYRPIFSINRQGWWLHSKPKETVLASAQ
ncbi:MAG: transglutaminase-like cysteine peptidase [Micavibrio sp.]